MTGPLVSILTPVYNRPKYIRESLESSLRQTYTNFEIVLIDNVSTDGTWEVCQEYAAKDSRIRLMRNDVNIGGLRNWIRTCQEARGVYCKTNFSDDTIAPDYLERAVPMMQDDVAFVVGSAEIGEAEGKGRVYFQWREKTGIYPIEDYLKATLMGTGPSSPAAMLHRTKDMQKNLLTGAEIESPTIKDFPVHAVGPDLLLQLLTAREYPKVAYIHEPLALMRSHAGTMTAAAEGKVNDCYAQTRIWFGLEYGPRWYLKEALGGVWIRKMRERGWVSPGDVKRQFLCDPDTVSSAEMLAGAWNMFRARLEGGTLLGR